MLHTVVRLHCRLHCWVCSRTSPGNQVAASGIHILISMPARRPCHWPTWNVV